MTTALTAPTEQKLPTDPKTGLMLPLSKHLGSQDLAKHRAMLAMECEYLAKKFDRFGWERERNTPAQDRQKLDFMDALQDFPLSEVQAACRAAVLANPNRMPNEGHVRAEIMRARSSRVAAAPAAASQPEPKRKRIDGARASEIMREIGFTPRRMGDPS
ncbi:MAG: hypothetical protein EpisKO_06390 [Epibacterium sp.]